MQYRREQKRNEMKETIEIRWHGRGGQGAVTAAKFLAEVALSNGKFVQAFPEYGPERTGAPILAFTRLSTNPINAHYSITNPDVVVVLDQTLLTLINVAQGLHKNGIILVNSEKPPQDINKYLNCNGKIFTVDANVISQETVGRTMPNMPMVGALIRVQEIIPLREMLNCFEKSFKEKFSAQLIEDNQKAIKRAYEEVKEG